VRLKGLGKLKKIHLIGIRSRDLPACSIVPQPTALPRDEVRVLINKLIKTDDNKEVMTLRPFLAVIFIVGVTNVIKRKLVYVIQFTGAKQVKGSQTLCPWTFRQAFVLSNQMSGRDVRMNFYNSLLQYLFTM
jgi:hypothetical protein